MPGSRDGGWIISSVSWEVEYYSVAKKKKKGLGGATDQTYVRALFRLSGSHRLACGVLWDPLKTIDGISVSLSDTDRTGDIGATEQQD